MRFFDDSINIEAETIFNKKLLNKTSETLIKIKGLVMRISDGKILPVIDSQGDEIRVIEYFEYVDKSPPKRPLKMWHKASLYINVEHNDPVQDLVDEISRLRSGITEITKMQPKVLSNFEPIETLAMSPTVLIKHVHKLLGT